MSINAFIENSKPLDVHDESDSITAVDNAGFTDILVIRARPGYDARAAFGFDVAAGAQPYASFRVLMNGSPWSNRLYNLVTSQPASITDPQALAVNMVDIPEGAYIQVQGKLTSAGANYALYARARIEYHEKA